MKLCGRVARTKYQYANIQDTSRYPGKLLTVLQAAQAPAQAKVLCKFIIVILRCSMLAIIYLAY